MLNVKQLVIIYLSVIIITFILLFLINLCIYKNLWWSSIVASFVLAICFLFLDIPRTSQDDQLLIFLIIIALFLPIVVTIYLTYCYGCWYNKPLLCECDTC